jgi:hypothetical protein
LLKFEKELTYTKPVLLGNIFWLLYTK